MKASGMSFLALNCLLVGCASSDQPKPAATGPEAQMALETRYTQVLSRVVGWRQDGRNVILVGAGEQRAALLEPAAKPKP